MPPFPTFIYDLETHPHYDAEECRHQEYLRRCILATHFYEKAKEDPKDLPEANRLYNVFLKYHDEWVEAQLGRPVVTPSTTLCTGPACNRRTQIWKKEWKDIIQGRVGPNDWIWPSLRYRFLHDNDEIKRYVNNTPVSSLRGRPGHLKSLKPVAWGDATDMDGARSINSFRNEPYNRILAGIDPPILIASTLSSFSDDCPTPTSFPSYLHFLDHGRPDSLSLQDTGTFSIIRHHQIGETGEYLYCVVYNPREPGQNSKNWWVQLSDLKDKGLIVERYHAQHKLGEVKWPSRKKSLQISGGLGVKEITSALDKRKLQLKQWGKWDSEEQRIHHEERWIMRDEWQRMGRGWGVAIEVVQMREKMWEEMDKIRKEMRPLTSVVTRRNIIMKDEGPNIPLDKDSTDTPRGPHTHFECSKQKGEPGWKSDNLIKSLSKMSEPVHQMTSHDAPANFDGQSSERSYSAGSRFSKAPGILNMPNNRLRHQSRRQAPLPSPLPFRGYPEWAAYPEYPSPTSTNQSGYFSGYQAPVPVNLFHSGPFVYRVSPGTSRDSSYEHLNPSWVASSHDTFNTAYTRMPTDSRSATFSTLSLPPNHHETGNRQLGYEKSGGAQAGWLSWLSGASKGQYFYGKRKTNASKPSGLVPAHKYVSNTVNGAVDLRKQNREQHIHFAEDAAWDFPLSEDDGFNDDENSAAEFQQWMDGPAERDTSSNVHDNDTGFLWLDGVAESKVLNEGVFEPDYFVPRESGSRGSLNTSTSSPNPQDPNESIPTENLQSPHDGVYSPSWPEVYKDIKHEHKRERNRLRRFIHSQSDSHQRLDDAIGEVQARRPWADTIDDTVDVDEASGRIERYIEEKTRRVSEQIQRLQNLLVIPTSQLTKEEASELLYLHQRYLNPMSTKTSANNSRDSSLHRGRTRYRSNISSPCGVFAMSPMDSTLVNSRFHQHHLANLPAYLDGQGQTRSYKDPNFMDHAQNLETLTPASEGSPFRKSAVPEGEQFVVPEVDHQGRHRLTIPAGWEPPAFLTTDCGCKLSHPLMTCTHHIKHWCIFLGRISDQMKRKRKDPINRSGDTAEAPPEPASSYTGADDAVDPLVFDPFKNPFPGMHSMDPLFDQGLVGMAPPAPAYYGDANNDSASREASSHVSVHPEQRQTALLPYPVPVKKSAQQRPSGGMGRKVSSASATRSAVYHNKSNSRNTGKSTVPQLERPVQDTDYGDIPDEDEARYSELVMRPWKDLTRIEKGELEFLRKRIGRRAVVG